MAKKPKTFNEKRKAYSINGAVLICSLCCRKMKRDPYLSPCTKLKSKWIKDFNIKPDILNLLEEKVGKSLEVIGTGENFLNRTTIAQISKIYKCDLMKLESFCKVKDIANKTNQESRDWEKTSLTPYLIEG